MGASLPVGGPAGLFLGFVAYGTIVMAVNQCFAEMITYLPIASPFVRLAGHWVDDALSFAMAYNFFFNMGRTYHSCSSFKMLILLPAFAIPYEITAINVLLTFWTDKVPIAAVVIACLVIYTCVSSF